MTLPIGSISNDPLDNDSMDPNDPNSIMYDPTLAENSATTQVVVTGKSVNIVVTPPTDDSNVKNPIPPVDNSRSDAAYLRAFKKSQNKI